MYLAREEETESLTKKLIQYSVLIICVSVIITVYQVSKGKIIVNQEIEEVLKAAYDNGASGKLSGGLLGAMFGVPLINLIGKVSTVILSIRNSSYFVCVPIWNKTSRNFKEHGRRKRRKKS